MNGQAGGIKRKVLKLLCPEGLVDTLMGFLETPSLELSNDHSQGKGILIFRQSPPLAGSGAVSSFDHFTDPLDTFAHSCLVIAALSCFSVCSESQSFLSVLCSPSSREHVPGHPGDFHESPLCLRQVKHPPPLPSLQFSLKGCSFSFKLL